MSDTLTKLRVKEFPFAPPLIYQGYRGIVDNFNQNEPFLCIAGMRSLMRSLYRYTGSIGQSEFVYLKIPSLSEAKGISWEKQDAICEFNLTSSIRLGLLEKPERVRLSILIEVIEEILQDLFAPQKKSEQQEKHTLLEEPMYQVSLNDLMTLVSNN